MIFSQKQSALWDDTSYFSRIGHPAGGQPGPHELIFHKGATMQQEHYLFCPGPVMVAPEVQLSLLHKQICHRVPDFERVIQSLQKNLTKIFRADDNYSVLLITGSGTAANETVISSQFNPKDKVLLINNGVFGDRLEEMLDIHEVKTTVLRYDWGDQARPEDIDKQLTVDPEITAVMMVCHETSTTVINPVTSVGEVTRAHKVRFFVDAVSALGGEDLDVIRDNIDVCTCSSNKCLASLAGVGIICVKRTELKNAHEGKPRVAYLNLRALHKFFETLHQTPNTPSVTMFIALDAAVKRLLEEGLDSQIARHRSCARILRNGVKKIGLKLFTDTKIASNTVTSVYLPGHIRQETFIERMETKGFTVYPGKGPLYEKNTFQMANMGMVNEKICGFFLDALADTIKELD
jgi:2-aminoethylphosphonate-pyruvate transaminase